MCSVVTGREHGYRSVMTFFVYIVRCADDSLYTGIATDVERRVGEHNAANTGARYTASRRPVTLVYHRECGTRSDALQEEARIKKLTRVQKDRLIATMDA
ncbi:MAG: GIY-YIG nuclease family protein [Hyphomicrobiaceae bacterium]